MVDRNGEEALDLARVQVHRDHAVDTGALERVGDELRGDRLARRRLLVLPRVGEPRDHGGDPLRRSELRRLDHDQQLDQVIVHRRVPGLDDEDVAAADRLAIADVGLAVREGLELDLAEHDPEPLGNRLGERGVRAAADQHQPLLRAALDPRCPLGLWHDGRLDRLEPGKCRLTHPVRASFGRGLPW